MKYVKDEKFNFKSWLDDVEKFNKNKKFIKFDIKVKYDGKFKFCINNAGKYKNAVKELYLNILEGIKTLAINEYQVNSELNIDEVADEINKHIGEYYEIFTYKDVNTLLEVIKTHVRLAQLSHIAKNVKYNENGWIYIGGKDSSYTNPKPIALDKLMDVLNAQLINNLVG